MTGHDESIWGVTLQLTTRFRKPLPLEGELRALGRITKQTSRGFEGAGEIYLPDGNIAVEAHGKFLKMPLDDIADFDPVHQEWGVVLSDDDPIEVEI